MESVNIITVNWSPDQFDGIAVRYDAASASVIVAFEADEVPSCTMRVVRSLHAAYDQIAQARADGVEIEQMLLTSRMDGIFNMGGDLGLMARAARSGDRATLDDYGRLTAGLVHRTWNGLGAGLTSIAVVDGDAFGGGCEAALSANIVVASRRSRFAFPETRFCLFPGMGATSLVGRKVSPDFAAAAIGDGRLLDAPLASSLGLVDRLTSRNAEKSLLRFLASNAAARSRIGEIARLRRLQAGYSIEEANTIVQQWVDAVLLAPDRTLVHIERIVKAQKARMIRRSPRPGSQATHL